MSVCSCDGDGGLGGDSSVDSAVPMLPAKLALSGPAQEFEAPFGYDGPPVSFDVRNISDEEVIGLAVRLAGLHPQQFRFESKCPERLAMGQSCTVDVRFRPRLQHDISASLIVSSTNGGTVSADLTGRGIAHPRIAMWPSERRFGFVGVGAMSNEVEFSVTNTGNGSTGMIVTSTDASNFSVSRNGCADLASSAICTIGVRFSPGIEGDFAGTVRVGTLNGLIATARMIGVGIRPPEIQFQMQGGLLVTVLDTGQQQVSPPATMPITVLARNNSTTATGMIAAEISGDHAGDFTLGSNTCTMVEPASMCSMQVTFNPMAAGSRTAILSLTGGAGQTGRLLLVGTGRTGPISVTPLAQDFGSVLLTTDSQQVTFAVTNASSSPVLVNASIRSADGDFVITRYGCSTTTNRTIEPLAPTATCTINVQFTPTAAGLRTGTLVLATSNATSVEVPLTGMGFL
jgi:hypothetical protein